MNWLAYLFLADPKSRYRIAAILPDFLPRQALMGLPQEFHSEIERHRRIDAYTDSHPIFRRSVNRFHRPFRRYGAIAVDVFYDHFLSIHWQRYSDVSLPTLLSDVYESIDESHEALPDETFQHLRRLREENWLSSYAEIHGITRSLARISLRFRRYFDLTPCVAFLEKEYREFEADFSDFFRDLLDYLQFTQLPKHLKFPLKQSSI